MVEDRTGALVPARRSLRAMARGLAASCHPGPVVVVTSIATLLALTVGVGGSTVLVMLAFFTGQLSVGWSNDWLDAERDAMVDRRDKPVAVGTISAGAVRRAALVAAAATIPLSLGLGLGAGLTHLVAVTAAWGYNAGIKGTWWSWAPYAVFFGLLPAVVVQALPGHPWPPAWMVAAGALLGVGAHLVNVLPDLEDDRSTGVRGLPHRLGLVGAGVLAPVVLVVASVLVVAGPRGEVGSMRWLVLIVVALVASAGAATAAAGRRRLPLLATASVAFADVVLLLASGEALPR